ncbi:hypothetical protein Sjap_024680 [Stephania japonica]|uniref:Uncharacterized protein n=1 Tax=Stephania japonica TaxID=461633 RepID=A0AAP0EJ69_9MAGN
MTGTLSGTPPSSYMGPTAFGVVKTVLCSVKLSSFHVKEVVESRRKPPLLAVLPARPPPAELQIGRNDFYNLTDQILILIRVLTSLGYARNTTTQDEVLKNLEIHELDVTPRGMSTQTNDSGTSSSSSRASLASLRNSLPENPNIYDFSEIRKATNNFLICHPRYPPPPSSSSCFGSPPTAALHMRAAWEERSAAATYEGRHRKHERPGSRQPYIIVNEAQSRGSGGGGGEGGCFRSGSSAASKIIEVLLHHSHG